MYLLPSVNMKLRPKILSEMKPGTRVVSHAFTMEDWQPDERSSTNGANVYFWVVPANVSGTWKVDGLGSGPVTLRFQQQFQKAQGASWPRRYRGAAARRRGERPEVTFTADVGAAPVRCRGRVAGDRMEGTAEGGAGKTWKAQRDPATKQPLDAPAVATTLKRVWGPSSHPPVGGPGGRSPEQERMVQQRPQATADRDHIHCPARSMRTRT